MLVFWDRQQVEAQKFFYALLIVLLNY